MPSWVIHNSVRDGILYKRHSVWPFTSFLQFLIQSRINMKRNPSWGKESISGQLIMYSKLRDGRSFCICSGSHFSFQQCRIYNSVMWVPSHATKSFSRFSQSEILCVSVVVGIKSLVRLSQNCTVKERAFGSNSGDASSIQSHSSSLKYSRNILMSPTGASNFNFWQPDMLWQPYLEAWVALKRGVP